MANIQTHYSVLVKANKQKEHTFMKEGKPVQDEIKETIPQYYKFKIDDPRTTKITVQLTTIHGDPDIFLSRKS